MNIELIYSFSVCCEQQVKSLLWKRIICRHSKTATPVDTSASIISEYYVWFVPHNDLPESSFYSSLTAIVTWHSRNFLTHRHNTSSHGSVKWKQSLCKAHADVSMRTGMIFCATGGDLRKECCNILNSVDLITHASCAVTCITTDTERNVRNTTVCP